MPPLPEIDENVNVLGGDFVVPPTSSVVEDGEETKSTVFSEKDGTVSEESADVGEAIYSNRASSPSVDLVEPAKERAATEEDTAPIHTVLEEWGSRNPIRYSISSDITLVGEGVDPNEREELASHVQALDRQGHDDSSGRLACHSDSKMDTRREQTSSKEIGKKSPKLCCELADTFQRVRRRV